VIECVGECYDDDNADDHDDHDDPPVTLLLKNLKELLLCGRSVPKHKHRIHLFFFLSCASQPRLLLLLL
jgi:hypothetical protein